MEITRTYLIFEDCTCCPAYRVPDAEGKIHTVTDAGTPCTMHFTKEIFTRTGEKIPNPVKGMCGITGKRVMDTLKPIIRYSMTNDPLPCHVEHLVSERKSNGVIIGKMETVEQNVSDI